jgi:hypothetical protein
MTRVPRLRRSGPHRTDTPALPGWADVWRSALRAFEISLPYQSGCGWHQPYRDPRGILLRQGKKARGDALGGSFCVRRPRPLGSSSRNEISTQPNLVSLSSAAATAMLRLRFLFSWTGIQNRVERIIDVRAGPERKKISETTYLPREAQGSSRRPVCSSTASRLIETPRPGPCGIGSNPSPSSRHGWSTMSSMKGDPVKYSTRSVLGEADAR